MQLKTILAAAAAATAANAQGSTPSLANALSSTDSLSTLNMLLGQNPDLLTTLGNASNITVFAPSNNAFRSLLNSSSFMSMNQTGYIPALLQYHVVNGTYTSQDISNTPAFVHTLLNSTQYSNVTGGQVVGVRTVGDNVEVISGLGARSNVTQADVMVSNGVVHIIDEVLTIPQNISTTALQANLTDLAGALALTNLLDPLDAASDITVFAPTNQAFMDIGNLLSNISASMLATILEYHVINGTVAYSSLLSNGNVQTMAGMPVNITITQGQVFVNSARVIMADVLIAEGVAHVIDSVLNPNGTAAPNPNQSTASPDFPGATLGPVPFTTISGIRATTTNSDLTMTTDAVAQGYTSAPSNALNSASSSAAAGRSSSSTGGAAAMQTGAMGGAALFGGAMLLANF